MALWFFKISTFKGEDLGEVDAPTRTWAARLAAERADARAKRDRTFDVERTIPKRYAYVLTQRRDQIGVMWLHRAGASAER